MIYGIQSSHDIHGFDYPIDDLQNSTNDLSNSINYSWNSINRFITYVIS